MVIVMVLQPVISIETLKELILMKIMNQLSQIRNHSIQWNKTIPSILYDVDTCLRLNEGMNGWMAHILAKINLSRLEPIVCWG